MLNFDCKNNIIIVTIKIYSKQSKIKYMKRSILLFILCLLFSSITVSAFDNPLGSVKNPGTPIPHIILVPQYNN
jgi:hypothetical protein